MRYTIVTINRNNADGLRATIESVLAQTCTDWEYIIVDGASTDGSVEVIRHYADRLAWWVSEKDGGIFPAMNKAIGHISGEYTVFLNSGDRMADNEVLDGLNNYKADIIMGASLNQYGQTNRRVETPLTLFRFLNGFCHQAVYYRSCLLRRRHYEELFPYTADLQLTFQLIFADHCTVDVSPRHLAIFETTGLSGSHPEAVSAESRRVLLELFPAEVVDDYFYFISLRSPILESLPYLATRYRMHRLATRLVRIITRISRWAEKRKGNKTEGN